MKRAIPLLLGLLMAAGAEDLTTTEGRVYKNVTVRKVEPDGLSISHESGLAKIPFTKLPKEVQKKHGYDPEAKAKEVEKEWAARDWNGRFELVTEGDSTVNLSYVEALDLRADSRERLEKELIEEHLIAEVLADIPAGGELRLSFSRAELEHVDTKWFSIIVRSNKGEEWARSPREPSTGHPVPGGDWFNVMRLGLPRALVEGDRVRVVDQLAPKPFDYVVKRKP
jgi:hypothetical protein